jgi:hypothetical protein
MSKNQKITIDFVEVTGDGLLKFSSFVPDT